MPKKSKVTSPQSNVQTLWQRGKNDSKTTVWKKNANAAARDYAEYGYTPNSVANIFDDDDGINQGDERDRRCLKEGPTGSYRWIRRSADKHDDCNWDDIPRPMKLPPTNALFKEQKLRPSSPRSKSPPRSPRMATDYTGNLSKITAGMVFVGPDNVLLCVMEHATSKTLYLAKSTTKARGAEGLVGDSPQCRWGDKAFPEEYDD